MPLESTQSSGLPLLEGTQVHSHACCQVGKYGLLLPALMNPAKIWVPVVKEEEKVGSGWELASSPSGAYHGQGTHSKS